MRRPMAVRAAGASSADTSSVRTSPFSPGRTRARPATPASRSAASTRIQMATPSSVRGSHGTPRARAASSAKPRAVVASNLEDLLGEGVEPRDAAPAPQGEEHRLAERAAELGPRSRNPLPGDRGRPRSGPRGRRGHGARRGWRPPGRGPRSAGRAAVVCGGDGEPDRRLGQRPPGRPAGVCAHCVGVERRRPAAVHPTDPCGTWPSLRRYSGSVGGGRGRGRDGEHGAAPGPARASLSPCGSDESA